MTGTGDRLWWELCFPVPSAVADDAAASLVGGSDALGVQLIDQGATTTLCASYEHSKSSDAIRAAAIVSLAGIGLQVDPGSFTLRSRDDADWATRWKEHFPVLQLTDTLWVVPSWRVDEPLRDDAVPIFLDPGMAFGTGQHETTELCARLLAETLTGLDTVSLAQARLLDVGTGSGILAIGAARLGVQRILGIDSDPTAVEVARHNVQRNDVFEAVHISSQPVEDVGGPFEIVVANILTHILIPMAEALARLAAPGGTLILSGLLATQADEVQKAYATAAGRIGRLDWRLARRVTKGEWSALVMGA